MSAGYGRLFSALKENGQLEALRRTVNTDVEALVSARSAQERTEMHEKLQKSLREMKVAHRTLRERASNAQNNLQAVENVAKQIKELDPSDTWPLLRLYSTLFYIYKPTFLNWENRITFKIFCNFGNF